MKKILFTLLVSTFLIGCSSKNYTIDGKVETPDLNGVTISIQIFDGKNWENLESLTIENQKFILKGSVEKPAMALLSFADPKKQIQGNATFVLENAKMKVEIDSDFNITISGTKQNKAWQALDAELNNVMPKELRDSIENNLLPQEYVQELFGEFQRKYNEIYKNFAIKEVNTTSGTFIFQNIYYTMSFEDKTAILDLMHEETKSEPQIEFILKQIEAEKKIAIGQTYSDFQLPDLNGNMLSLSELVGKSDYLLIDFWASWCGPCIHSFPELTKFYNENKGEKFEILGVSFDNDGEKWKSAIEKHGLIWRNVSDLKGWQSEAGQLYAISSIPCTILIDKEGTIVGRNMSLSELTQLLK